ncbi:MAG: AlkA N-terminal domain-containing protein [bacterium]
MALLAGKATVAGVARTGGWRSAEALEAASLRKMGATARAWLELPKKLHYRFRYGGPFNAARTLAYLGRDPESLSERLEDGGYCRYFPVAGQPVAVRLTLGKADCRVELQKPLDPAGYLELHDTVRRFLGLDQPLREFYRVARENAVMAPLVGALPGVRIPQLPTLWEALSWAVVGQQINLTFAYRLRNRLIRLGQGGRQAPAGFPLPFPTAEQVLAIPPEKLRENQFSRQKAAYLGNVARACLEGPLRELSAADPERATAALLSVKGIGRWSAAYGLMRGLGWMDALPVGDAGLRTALLRRWALPAAPGPARQEELMEPFRPYRALATYYLWKSLELPGEG